MTNQKKKKVKNVLTHSELKAKALEDPEVLAEYQRLNREDFAILEERQNLSVPYREPKISRLLDSDMQAVPAALARAAQRARELAESTGTPLIVIKDGKLIEEMVTADTMPVGVCKPD
jgi:hypothetical protein